jgi:hypothetical protein
MQNAHQLHSSPFAGEVNGLFTVEVMRNSQWKIVDVSNLVATFKVISYMFHLKFIGIFKGLHRENLTVFINILLTADTR